ncbi:MAG TPA: 5-formyltetrahydrofolate cyclo-ligase [Candidatus Bilamarchaeum sp.]|nr:5-formyltetrahydrofolate cyclo-ligase [Candidatus Bilamarchaeum sp.]
MVRHLKDALRKEMLSRRDLLPAGEVAGKSAAIAKSLFSRPRFLEAKTIGLYLPKGNEVDTRDMISMALRKGKEVVVPVTNEKIEFFHFSSFGDLVPGKYGILEPQRRIKPCNEPDLVVAPGVSFGLCMHRLGYGKGYYDEYLSKSFAYRIGICYDFQVVEKLPSHVNDERMDEIITEKRVIE